MTVTCVIADDHPPVLGFVSRYLSNEGVAVAASAQDGEEALRKIEQIAPTVAVLDVRMPRLSGVEVMRALAASGSSTRVILYTGYADAALLAEALEAGVSGLIDKDAPLEDLLRAVRTVAEGGSYVDPGLGARLLGRRTGAPALTPREREVLVLLADGLSNEAIGERLSISPQTVRTHVQKAMARLGAATRTQAVATALREFLIA